jgi:hypothetical protein
MLFAWIVNRCKFLFSLCYTSGLIDSWAFLGLCEMPWVGQFGFIWRGMDWGWLVKLLHRGLGVFVRPDAWLGRLRGCPPCRPRADNSSLMPLRRPNQAPGQPQGGVCAAASAPQMGQAGRQSALLRRNTRHVCKIFKMAACCIQGLQHRYTRHACKIRSAVHLA